MNHEGNVQAIKLSCAAVCRIYAAEINTPMVTCFSFLQTLVGFCCFCRVVGLVVFLQLQDGNYFFFFF